MVTWTDCKVGLSVQLENVDVPRRRVSNILDGGHGGQLGNSCRSDNPEWEERTLEMATGSASLDMTATECYNLIKAGVNTEVPGLEIYYDKVVSELRG